MGEQMSELLKFRNMLLDVCIFPRFLYASSKQADHFILTFILKIIDCSTSCIRVF